MLIETGKEAFARPWECPDALVLLPSLERRRLQCYLFLICADVAMIFLAFAGAGSLYMGTQGLRMGSLMAQLLLPCYLTVALYNGAYSLKSLQKAEYGAVRAVIALGLSSAVVVFIAFYTKSSEDFSRAVFTLSVAGAVISLPWGRFQARAVVSWRCGAQVLNELVIDDGGPALDLPQIRHLDAVRHGLSPSQTDPVALDRMGLILRNVDRVIVSCPPERRAAWALLLKGANIEGEVIDEAVIALGARGARQAGGQGLLLVSLGPLGLRARAMKRLLDIAISLGALVVFAPLLAVCAVMVKLEDGGPVLFVQRRMGRGNTFFKMYKLRSMAVARLDHDGSCSTARSDARVTRIGRFIRRTSIDELPQLFNVLAGDMSTSAGRSSSWRWTVIA